MSKDNKIFLETFGCQMNILDSELIKNQFTKAGYDFVSNADEAKIVLLNTCSVRDVSEHKVLSRLGKIKIRKNRGEDVVVGVLGCMAERAHDELISKNPFIDLLVGPSKIHDTLKLVEFALKEPSNNQKSLSGFKNRKALQQDPFLSPLDDLEILDQNRHIDGVKFAQAYVRITRGCNKFCSFCVVPRTRGPEMHRHPHAIIKEINNLVDNGAKEVTLLGQTINHYYYQDGGQTWSFADLLYLIHENIKHLPRIRFLTSYPRDFTDEALDVMKDCPRICRYLHIPAQSGSNDILKAMNRGYDIDTYLSLIERAKKRMPDISLVGDMIVGFPGETDKDFQLSIDLLLKVSFKNVFVFKYSPRPHTNAFKLVDSVPIEVKKQRNNEMLKIQNQISLQIHNNMIDKDFEILCEGESKIKDDNLLSLNHKKYLNLMGRTRGDHIVHFTGEKTDIGSLLMVKINKAGPLSLNAHRIIV